MNQNSLMGMIIALAILTAIALMLALTGCQEAQSAIDQIVADPNIAAHAAATGDAVAQTGSAIAAGGAASGNLAAVVIGSIVALAGTLIGVFAKTHSLPKGDKK